MNVLLFYGLFGCSGFLATAGACWLIDQVRSARERTRETNLFIERVGSEHVRRVPANDVNEGDTVIAHDDTLHTVFRVHRYRVESGHRYVWLFGEPADHDHWDWLGRDTDVVTVIPREVMA